MNITFKQNLIAAFQQHFGDDLVAILLFGSQARGDAAPESDHDIFLLARNLPERYMPRLFHVRQAIAGKFAEKINFIARTPEEFERGFPPLYLDLATDGILLYDRKNYLAGRLSCIREIIKSSGLKRKKLENELSWEWQRPPNGPWEITWEGYREFRH